MINKDKLKGFIGGILVMAAIFTTVAFAENAQKALLAVFTDIKLVVNGTPVTPKDANGNVVEPFAVDGTTYLPVRAVANALGQEVSWDGETSTIYIGTQPEKKETLELTYENIAGFWVNAHCEDKFVGFYFYQFNKDGTFLKTWDGYQYFTYENGVSVDGWYPGDFGIETLNGTYTLKDNTIVLNYSTAHLDLYRTSEEKIIIYDDTMVLDGNLYYKGEYSLEELVEKYDFEFVYPLKLISKRESMWPNPFKSDF